MHQGLLFPVNEIRVVAQPPVTKSERDFHSPAGPSGWHDRGEVVLVDSRFLDEAWNVISCSTLIEKKQKLRGAVEHGGSLWATTGGWGGGNDITRHVDAVEMIPADQWSGEVYLYTDVARKRLHYYYAMLVKHRGREYVLGPHRCQLVQEEKSK